MELLNITNIIDWVFWKFDLFGPVFIFSIFIGSIFGISEWLVYNSNKPGYLKLLKDIWGAKKLRTLVKIILLVILIVLILLGYNLFYSKF